MRKGQRGRRDSSNKSLVRGLVLPLFEKCSIQTTVARARLVQGVVDGLVLKIKNDTLNDRRAVMSSLAINPVQAEKIFSQIKSRLDNRTSGFTRIIKIGRRAGDNAPLVKLELIVNKPEEVRQPKKAKKELSSEAVA